MGPASLDLRSAGDELLTNLLNFAVHSIGGAVGAGINIAVELTGESHCLAVNPEDANAAGAGVPHSVAAVGVACTLDPVQWKQSRGPLWQAFRTGRLVQVPDPAVVAARVPAVDFGAPRPPHGAAKEWAGLSDPADLADLAEPDRMLAALVDVDPAVLAMVRGGVFSVGESGGEVPVILSVYLDRPADARTLREIDTYEPVITQALSVVEYCAGEERVAQQMLQMSQYRRVIEQAKGLVMGAIGGDAGSAFATLARASQHFNVRLRHLAVALVEHVGDGEAEHPDDPDLVITLSRTDRQAAARVWAALTASGGARDSGAAAPG